MDYFTSFQHTNTAMDVDTRTATSHEWHQISATTTTQVIKGDFQSDEVKLTREEWDTVHILGALNNIILSREDPMDFKRCDFSSLKLQQKKRKKDARGSPTRKKKSPGSAFSSRCSSPAGTPRGSPRTATKRENHECPNCHATESTLWRNCIIQGKVHYLCNACGLRFKKGKYCPLCYKVYYDVDTNPQSWKQCVCCNNWTHASCLVSKEGEAAMERPYTCANCLRYSDHRDGDEEMSFFTSA